jgi:dual specificity protein kinase YAK1
VLESELNAIEAFIDFLKGILRIDKDMRWTAGMALEHPFVTRETWTGPFEPKREISTHES